VAIADQTGETGDGAWRHDNSWNDLGDGNGMRLPWAVAARLSLRVRRGMRHIAWRKLFSDEFCQVFGRNSRPARCKWGRGINSEYFDRNKKGKKYLPYIHVRLSIGAFICDN